MVILNGFISPLTIAHFSTLVTLIVANRAILIRWRIKRHCGSWGRNGGVRRRERLATLVRVRASMTSIITSQILPPNESDNKTGCEPHKQKPVAKLEPIPTHSIPWDNRVLKTPNNKQHNVEHE
jgi:hypothetical protein